MTEGDRGGGWGTGRRGVSACSHFPPTASPTPPQFPPLKSIPNPTLTPIPNPTPNPTHPQSNPSPIQSLSPSRGEVRWGVGGRAPPPRLCAPRSPHRLHRATIPSEERKCEPIPTSPPTTPLRTPGQTIHAGPPPNSAEQSRTNLNTAEHSDQIGTPSGTPRKNRPRTPSPPPRSAPPAAAGAAEDALCVNAPSRRRVGL